MSKLSQILLQHIETKKIISLPHKQFFVLGRNEKTGIKDSVVSREQILCFADLSERKVKIKPVGKALSGANGFALLKDKVYTLDHGDIIETAIGRHKFQIIFEPNPETERNSSVQEREAKKPRMEFPVFNLGKTSGKTKNSTDKLTPAKGGMWEEGSNKELLIFTSTDHEGKNKIASFDLDGTLIKTKSGARFPKNADDWVINYDTIKDRLKQLVEDNYKLVIFTNQSGVGKDTVKIKEFKRKIENILSKFNVPMQVFIALGKDFHRKPRIGMWQKLVEDKNDGVDVDVNTSFYCGDAAGREKNWAPKRNKDHSAADRLFAINLGLKFYTPEEFFLKQPPAPFKMPEFDPRESTDHLTVPDIGYDKLNVVLMVGGPGSGKSVFAKSNLLSKGYVHVSRDVLGNWQKCVKLMEESLEKNKNVVIDNTNADKETRQRFIQAAKKFKADVRGFVMSTSMNQMRHNNKFRELTDKSHAIVSDIIIFSYRKNYQEPEENEGFDQILKIPFIPKFQSPDLERLYKLFLLD